MRSILIQAGVIVFAVCVGATAMHAWHTRVPNVDKAAAAPTGSMSDIIRALHSSAHHLPVQAIEDYN